MMRGGSPYAIRQTMLRHLPHTPHRPQEGCETAAPHQSATHTRQPHAAPWGEW